MLFSNNKNANNRLNKYYCNVIIIVSFLILLVACNNKKNSEKSKESKFFKLRITNEIVKQNDRDITKKIQNKKIIPTNFANQEVVSKQINSFEKCIEEKPLIEGSIESIINHYGLPVNWSSSQWVIIAHLLCQTNENNYSKLLKVLGPAFHQLETCNKQEGIDYANNLIKTGNIIDNPYQANRLFLEASDIQQWFVNQKLGRKTKEFLLNRMVNGKGYNKSDYLYLKQGVAKSYGYEGDYERSLSEFDKILEFNPDLSPDEKFNIILDSARICFHNKSPTKFRDIGLKRLKQLIDENNISIDNHETALLYYRLALEKLAGEN